MSGQYRLPTKTHLTPCPFCGNDLADGFACSTGLGERSYIECLKCGAKGPVFKTDKWLAKTHDENGKKRSLKEQMKINDLALNRAAQVAWNERAALARCKVEK